MIIPFGIFNIVKGNYGTLNIIIWMLGMYLLALIVNYANFLIKEICRKYHSLPSCGYRTGVFFWLDYYGVLKSHYFQVLFLIL
jgi:hypothetical protein